MSTPMAGEPSEPVPDPPPPLTIPPPLHERPDSDPVAASQRRTRWGPFVWFVVTTVFGCVVGVLVVAIRNPGAVHRFTGKEFKVGDCVTVAGPPRHATMSRTTCVPSSPGASSSDVVYRVDTVLDGKGRPCPQMFEGGAGFSNEPEGTTYCLVVNAR